MTRALSKLLAAGLAIVLLGGVATPVVAQADSTTDTVTAATNASDEQTYTVGSVEFPYTSVIQNSQESKNYWVHKADDDPTIGTPHSITTAQMADSDYMAALTAANDDNGYVAAIKTQFDFLTGGTITLSKGETVGQYFFTKADSNQDISPAEYQETLGIQTYLNVWMAKSLTLAKLGEISASEISASYNKNLRPILAANSLTSAALSDMDNLFGTADNFTNLQTYLIDTFLPQLLVRTSFDTLTEAQLIQSSPEVSANIVKTMWDQPMSDYLAKQTDGSYQLSGAFLFLTFNVISDGTIVTKPTIPVIPTPAKSQPITVHYVDDQGKTLAADKTLTGDLNAAYQSDALAITGYKLTQTPANATGKFTSDAQTVTYVYTKQGTLQTGSAADTIEPIAAKGTVVYATKKVGLYKTATFSKKARKQWYVKKSRMNRPMFVVTGYATSKNGVKRYRVKDVNHRSATAGKTGYLTTNRAYTTPVYYATKHKTVTVINPTGVNSYAKKTLTGKKTHYQQGQVLTVKKIVTHKLTTRFVLSNGRYITANKKLVRAGKVTMPSKVTVKRAINRYDNANLTKKNKAIKRGTTLKVRGWRYSNANNFSKHDTLRYHVAGGYITANPHFVKTIR